MKNLSFLLTFFLGGVISLTAQQVEPIHWDAIYQIKKEGLQNSKVMDIAFQLTDVSGPRLTASPGLQRAKEYAVNILEEWGLDNVKEEKWGEFGRGWEVEKSYVAMTAPYYQSLIASPKAWTPGTGKEISGEVVLVEIDDEEDLADYRGKLKNKIVVIPPSSEVETSFEADAKRYTAEELEKRSQQPMGSSSRYSPEMIAQWRKRRRLSRTMMPMLKEEGVKLILRGMRGKHGTFFTSNGASRAVDAEPSIPELEVAPEHINHLVRLIEADVPVTVEAETETKFYDEDLNEYNVIAEIPGTDPELKDEVVMLGAHLDSWHAATGATDNAAGSAVMMEAVRILKSIDAKPRRTIRLALWTGEEQGIYGSRAYVSQHFADRNEMVLKPEYDKLAGYFNIDNGTGRIRGIYLQGNEAVRPIFDAWFTPFDDMIDNRTITIRNTGGTDHLSFDAVGLPGFQFIQDPISYNTRTHHTNMDTYERLQKEDLMQMSVIVASFVYHTAMRDEKLPREPRPVVKEASGR
ncbi:MAG: M20/M25/M40 family metallo-hydrolase [Bacteroidota bacterium]